MYVRDVVTASLQLHHLVAIGTCLPMLLLGDIQKLLDVLVLGT
jgi:hypothetical protein